MIGWRAGELFGRRSNAGGPGCTVSDYAGRPCSEAHRLWAEPVAVACLVLWPREPRFLESTGSTA